MNPVLQDVLKMGSGVYINPKVQNLVPVAAKTGTSNTNGATWVVGYTSGLATASFFGDTLEGQKRPGQNVTINGNFYKAIDGYMLAGPQWANYMQQLPGCTRPTLPAAPSVHEHPARPDADTLPVAASPHWAPPRRAQCTFL